MRIKEKYAPTARQSSRKRCVFQCIVMYCEFTYRAVGFHCVGIDTVDYPTVFNVSYSLLLTSSIAPL